MLFNWILPDIKIVLAVKWNFFSSSAIVRRKRFKNHSMGFLFIVCVYDHTIFLSLTHFFPFGHEKNIAIKHKSINHRKEKEGTRKISGKESAYPAVTLLQPIFIYFTIFGWFFFFRLGMGFGLRWLVISIFWQTSLLPLCFTSCPSKSRQGSRKAKRRRDHFGDDPELKAWKLSERKVNDAWRACTTDDKSTGLDTMLQFTNCKVR